MAGGLTACRPEAGRGRSRGAGDVLQDGIRQNDGGIEGRGGGWLCLVEGPYTGTNTPIDERHAARWSPAAIALRESGVVASVCARTGPRRRRVPERVGAARGEAAGGLHLPGQALVEVFHAPQICQFFGHFFLEDNVAGVALG